MEVKHDIKPVGIHTLKAGEVGRTLEDEYLMVLEVPSDIMPLRYRGATYVVDIKTGIVEAVGAFDRKSMVERVEGSFFTKN